MAGNSWWQPLKKSNSSQSTALHPFFQFQSSTAAFPTASADSITGSSPPATAIGTTSPIDRPARQASKASRKSRAPDAKPSPEPSSTSPTAVRALTRARQEESPATGGSSEAEQSRERPPKQDEELQSSLASERTPGSNRRARRAHLQWQGGNTPAGLVPQGTELLSSSAPAAFLGRSPVAMGHSGALATFPTPSPLAALPPPTPSGWAGSNGMKKARFPAYASHEELGQGLKRGQYFKANLRVNAHDRSQAFATLPDLPSDLMIRGSVAQNRAVEGDIVALEILPPSSWFIAGALIKPDSGGGGGGGGRALQHSASAMVALTSAGVDLPDDCSGPAAADVMSGANGEAAGGESKRDGGGAVGKAGAQKGRGKGRREGTPRSSSTSDLVEATRARLEAAFGGSGAKPPWADAASPQDALQIIRDLLAERPELRATARVVGVLEPSRRRGAIVGVLKEEPGGGALLLIPCDPRLPRCLVRSSELPNDIKASLKAEAKNQVTNERTLVSGMLEGWDVSAAFPLAQIRSSLGQAGCLATESKAMMEMEAVRDEPFREDVLACLPATPWSISDEEISRRRDLRATRICSIDPLTARDLDDALSIEPLPPGTFLGGAAGGGGGGWRVGVHIADVAHFVPAGSALDCEARERATSVYMVDRVIPMLPRLLCERLCSLNPGEDRLTFSVIWDMTEDGKVLNQWAGRTVIRSCAKLAYEHAQAMIEGTFNVQQPPVPLDGPHTWPQVVGDVLALHRIAAARRRARFENGALRLDNVKLNFTLDADGNPIDAHPHVQREANQLVEEFMLLANMSVAALIAEAFPDRALLRRHPAPHQRKMEELAATAAGLDVALDIGSAAGLQASLSALREHSDILMLAIVQLLATKPMQLATYFCTGEMEERSEWRHYALAVPEYTHFTSPIRRYPDIIVHRLLAAALQRRADGSQEADAAAAQQGLLGTQECAEVAKHCNERKLAAKMVQEASSRLYLAVLLRRRPRICEAVVMGLAGSKFLDLYIPDLGIELRVHVGEIAPAPVYGDWDSANKTLELSRGGNAPADGDPGQQQPHPAVVRDIDNFAAATGADATRPAALPLQLRMFDRVPVLVSARQHGASGKPAEPFARLYLSG